MFERFFPAVRKAGPATLPENPFEAIERFWRAPLSGPGGGQPPTPRVDVKETDDAVQVTAELPGMDPKDVELTLENGVLTIRGQKRETSERKEGETVLAREIRYGSFSRSLALPGAAAGAEATARFDKGVLTVTVPKSPEARPTRVPIQG